MDLTFSASEQAFRDELRAWLGANHPGPEPDGDVAGFEFRRAWQRRLHQDGWAGVSWPKEYGGRGATLVEQAIYNEEVARAQAPSTANVLGLAMGGPTVIAHGTEEQKRRYLEPILSADEIWCQGFSEPEAGSDLASLKTRAVRDGDEWVVTGQKVWTTFAHEAKDMEQDAVQVRPLRQITGEAEFNELFIEEARIPHENILGGEGNGWAVAITTLMHERAGLGFGSAIQLKIALGELMELARERGVDEDPVIRQKIAQLYIEAECLRLTASRGLTQQMKTGIPGPEGSLVKWQWSDTNQAMTELATEVRGPEGPIVDDEWTYRFLRARANSIEGGTTEILKNIVAERVIGLPRMR
jgi:alkylation response protein AidB-like acyl-CoA dehydrogenase